LDPEDRSTLTSADSFKVLTANEDDYRLLWAICGLVDIDVLEKFSSILKREGACTSETSVSLLDYMA
jgi:hypothetical protein